MSQSTWPTPFQPKRVRIARPTDRLREIVIFYRDVIGLHELGSFENHDDYSGVMLGLPDWSFHLEFTENRHLSVGSAPSKDNLLVFYVSPVELEAIHRHMHEHGHEPVAPENPYWQGKSLSYEDPGGWRVVFSALD